MSIGYIHSLQSLGTVDGPGVRFVVFMQGCPLRCKCCHNPDTWGLKGGTPYTAEELVQKIERYREYFGNEGGVTVSGGEPLLQAPFVEELFRLCHQKGIHTCLDTAGCMLNEQVKSLLQHTDRVLLDYKYTDDALYFENTGCLLQTVQAFLQYLNEQNIPTTLRQVIIPTVNDTTENVRLLKAAADAHPTVDKIELLPFRKLCQPKYDNLGLPFPFAHISEPSKETMEQLNEIIQ